MPTPHGEKRNNPLLPVLTLATVRFRDRFRV